MARRDRQSRIRRAPQRQHYFDKVMDEAALRDQRTPIALQRRRQKRFRGLQDPTVVAFSRTLQQVFPQAHVPRNATQMALDGVPTDIIVRTISKPRRNVQAEGRVDGEMNDKPHSAPLEIRSLQNSWETM